MQHLSNYHMPFDWRIPLGSAIYSDVWSLSQRDKDEMKILIKEFEEKYKDELQKIGYKGEDELEQEYAEREKRWEEENERERQKQEDEERKKQEEENEREKRELLNDLD